MAMTSEEVNQLISSQTAAIAQANAQASRMGYAQGLAEQGPQGDAIGSAIPSMAAAAASYAGNIPNAVLPAVSLAAGFGLLPRVLDPFTQSLAIGSSAAKAAGGWMGGGLAAGIGAAAVPFAAYTAAGVAADHLAIDPFKTGAQMRGMSLGAIQSYMPDVPMSSMGATASMMESMQRNKQYSMQDTMGLMSLGVAGGSINTNNMSQFQSSFKSLINETQQVAQALSSSLSEAYGAMQQIKGLGVSNVSGTAYAMRGLGVAGGIAPAEMMSIAQGGASLAKMAGISRDVGVAGAMTSAATFGMVGANKSLGQDFGMEDLGMMQNAGYRFFGTRQGSSVVAAMMDESGEINASMASRIAQGTVSKAEINRLANITRNKRPDMLAANSTEIVAQYMSEYGPQGISNPLTTMTRGMANPESAKMQMTGLNQEGMGELAALSMNSGSIKAQLAQAAQEGFNQGTQRLGLADSLQLAMQKMTAPIRDKFQQMGSQVAQSIAETVDDVTRDFMTRPALRSDMSGVNAIQSFNQAGNYTAANNVRSMLGSVGGEAAMSLPSQPGYMAGFLPRGLSADANMQNTAMMPMNGMLPSNLGTIGMAGVATAMGGGALGRGIFAAGTGMVNALPTAGFFGSRQLGALAPLVARGTQGAGLLLRAAGAVAASPLGLAVTATQLGVAGINAVGERMGLTNSAEADTSVFGEEMAFQIAAGKESGGRDWHKLGYEVELADTSWADRSWSGYTGNQITTKLDMQRVVQQHRKNLPEYRSMRAAAFAGDNAAKQLEVDNIDSQQDINATQKAMRVGKLLGIGTEEAHKILLAGPNSALMNATENQFAKSADKWFGDMADKKKNWFNSLTDRGILGGFVSDSDTAAAEWGAANRSSIATAAKEVILSGATMTPDEMQTAIKEKIIAGADSADRGKIGGYLGFLSSKGMLTMLGRAEAMPAYQALLKQDAANAAASKAAGPATEKYIAYAATAAGLSPLGLSSAHNKFLAENVDSTTQTKLVADAVGSYEAASSQNQAVLASNLARDPSQFGQKASALLSIQARVKGLDEAYLEGDKSSGRKWVEEFLGVQLGGTGVDKSLRGENNITPAKTRERIRKGVEQMLSANLGVDPSQFSAEQVSTVDINTRKIINHAQEKGGSSVKEIAALFMPMQTNAAPNKTEGQQAMMMKNLENVVNGLTVQLKNLSDRLPQTSGG